MPDITVIIATRNRADAPIHVVEACLTQVADMDAEILVVDQSDPDHRIRQAAQVAALDAAPVRYLSSGTIGLPAARNEGLAAARGEIVLFLDDDVRLLPGCIRGHLAAYDDPWVGGVVGRIHECRVEPNRPRTINRLSMGGRVLTRLDGMEPCEVRTLKGANMSYRRVALLGAGPADERYTGTAFLEDADWSTRVRALGWTLRYAPDAALIHLALGAGGCRVEDDMAREWWRFHNTAYFVRRHRPWTAPLVLGTFAGIAMRRGWQWHKPLAPARLMGALVQGWRSEE